MERSNPYSLNPRFFLRQNDRYMDYQFLTVYLLINKIDLLTRNSMLFLLLYVTHPSKPEAVKLSVDLLNQHLIACVNYYPMESMYWWE